MVYKDQNPSIETFDTFQDALQFLLKELHTKTKGGTIEKIDEALVCQAFNAIPLPKPPISLPFPMLPMLPKLMISVECAANSAARALIMNGVGNFNGAVWQKSYSNFSGQFPSELRDILQQNPNFLETVLAILGNPEKMAQMRKDNPMDSSLGEIIQIANDYQCDIKQAAGAKEFCDKIRAVWNDAQHFGSVGVWALERCIGPSPALFANHLNRLFTKEHELEAFVTPHEEFELCAKNIIEDLKMQKPVTIMLFWEVKCWHYSNIVAAALNGKQQLEYVILLDTNKKFQIWNCAVLHYYMENRYKIVTNFCVKTPKPGKFTLIRYRQYEPENEGQNSEGLNLRVADIPLD